MNRMILKKLVFEGSNKEPSAIDFTSGFNVISGPSDTGKSLIFECINYVLGGNDQPKEPPEAKGYTNLFLTIIANSKYFTIERSVLSNDVKIYEGNYDDISENTEHIILSSKAQAKDNLSDYLLEITGIKNKKLKKNERNETISLTFNVLRKLLLVDEGIIQAKISPIFSGNKTSETSEKALFRFLLTGIDYSNVIVQQKPEIRKADANARITILDQLIRNNSLILKKDISKEDLQDELSKLESSIENEIIKISVSHKEIEDLQKKRKLVWDAAITADSKIDQLKEILNRFNLLAQHYKSDLDRLDAIIETGEVLSLTSNFHCPLCGSEPRNHKPECVISDQEIENVKDSCIHEKKKIHSLESDLASTIKQIDFEINDLIDLKRQNENEHKRIDTLINERLEPTIIMQKEQLRNLFDTKKDVEISISVIGQIDKMEELKVEAKQNLKPLLKEEKVPTGAKAAEIGELLEVIEAKLKSWKFPDLGRIGFSEEKQDITIGIKNRTDQGKGFRAITHSAFIIALMDFCIDRNMPHPGFVILDSPLVTFRGAEKKIKTDEAIPDDTKKEFYRSLASLPDDRQIIVIENDPPPPDIIKNINYVQFTKDALGRYGFCLSERIINQE